MDELKKVLILTADAGFGHRSAAKAIQTAFNEISPNEFEVSLINPLNNKKAPAFLRDSQSEYDRWIKNVPELYKFGYEMSDSPIPVTILETILIVSLYEVMREMLEEYQPDLIITTYPLYQAPIIAVKSIQRIDVPLVTVITDISTIHTIWFNEKADLIIAPNDYVKEDAIEAGVDREKVTVVGIPVNPKIFQIKESKNQLKQKFGWDEKLPAIMAVGGKRVEHFKETVHLLNLSGFDFQLIIVTGKDETLYEEMNDIEWNHKVFRYKFVDTIPEFMKASDLIVTKAGGLIVTESLASGLPLLLIDVIPGQESGNAKFVEDGKAGIWVKNTKEFLEAMAWLFFHDQKNLKKIQDNARGLGKPSSAFEIVKLVIDKHSKGDFFNETKVDFIHKVEELLNKYQISIVKKKEDE